MPQSIKSRNYSREVSDALCVVCEEHRDEDLTRDQLCQLVVSSGKLPQIWVDGVREKALSKAIGAILRSRTFKNGDGEKIRLFQCYQQFEQTDDGQEVQREFWRNIHTMSRVQMRNAYLKRKSLAKAVDEKAERDKDYWNQEVAPKLGEAEIQSVMVFGEREADR